MKQFEINGGNARAELYGLLSKTRILYSLAINATTRRGSDLTDLGAIAGHEIFRATYDAVSACKWGDGLPTFDDLSEEKEATAAVLPYPILIALAYFLDSAQTVCLKSWRFRTGNPDIDRAVVAWPNAILWGTPAKMRFFYDLFASYEGFPTENPLLSNGRTRASQLLMVGRYLLERELKKIGQPDLSTLAKVKNKNILLSK
ncbi:hypothetical protein A3A84_03010 [Candidatus Collierbacteria bacterium RIFCSPLOWO2_01_FULL_50_23]|uniref:Uncharacterized protein n=2 Tax=Candidatus Collieribacteriota TaxID=1752725 RepID=A0A1F5EW71_9BACT|nr:MAG: hypothetical protein A3D09_02650 [Candidatus Collierbacteria bacterium RIFCSPHIGHO2_02_FULL_49_10]OGD71615.1 MAG: hypothetical protein A2703_03885 [Candidatus Collierbacteria bacterium RIFCSPHIGHO2_01_FULL_50_25]OGD74429.1 MAG: hypothetical protein A3A84_03010 [Candidatus Collierbacteria bacterium RIFCSPLOWO2_01_FULL_50_23]